MSTTEQAKPNKKVILVNGPPGCGKTTCVETMMGYISFNEPWLQPREIKVSEPLKRATHSLFGVYAWSWDHFDKENLQSDKDKPCNEFFGQTPRDAYIAVSDYAREKFGVEFFGWIARRQMALAKIAMVFVIDCGVLDELPPIIDYVGEENVLVIEVHAVNKNYDNDGRAYIGAELKKQFPQITVQRVDNEFGDLQDKELFKVFCRGAAKNFLNIQERVV